MQQQGATADLVQRLRAGDHLVGTWSSLDSPAAAEVMAAAGFDVVILDLEHGELGVPDLTAHLRAIEVAGAASLVRVADPGQVGRALEAGADGVLAPDVTSAETAARVVASGRYAPHGTRGSAPMARDVGYGLHAFAEHHADADPLLGVQIEGPEGMAALDEIVAVDGLGLVFVGPHDLSQRLGVPGQVTHPAVVEAIGEVAGRARAHGVATGVWAPDAEVARTWLDAGISLVTVSNVALVLSGAARSLREALR